MNLVQVSDDELREVEGGTVIGGVIGGISGGVMGGIVHSVNTTRRIVTGRETRSGREIGRDVLTAMGEGAVGGFLFGFAAPSL